MSSEPEEILAEYKQRRSVFEQFVTKLVVLLSELLRPHEELVHSINGRVKDFNSLEAKIYRPSARYKKLDDITDVAGIRIIVYFASDVDRIAEVVRREFEIDHQNSVDKRALLDPDQFGYLSLHYVVGISEDRLRLTENLPYRRYKAEIQIRSILQHSWAEIHHDIGYKSKLAVPRELLRAFSRVASLLELADDEYDRIRSAMVAYRADVPTRIAGAPSEVTIDQDSLLEFARTSKLVSSIDLEMAEATGVEEINPAVDWVEDYVSHLAHFGIRTIAELQQALEEQRAFLISYARERLSKMGYGLLIAGVSITYLPFGLAAKSLRTENVVDYFEIFHQYAGREEEREPVASIVVEIAKRLIG